MVETIDGWRRAGGTLVRVAEVVLAFSNGLVDSLYPCPEHGAALAAPLTMPRVIATPTVRTISARDVLPLACECGLPDEQRAESHDEPETAGRVIYAASRFGRDRA
jgi:hypothetical protein